MFPLIQKSFTTTYPAGSSPVGSNPFFGDRPAACIRALSRAHPPCRPSLLPDRGNHRNDEDHGETKVAIVLLFLP